MALITTPPELTCGFQELPQNNSPFRALQASKQIFNYSGKTFTYNQATFDSAGGSGHSANFPLALKRGSPWTKPDASTWFSMIDDWGYKMLGGMSQCSFGSKLYAIGATQNPGYLIYVPFDMNTEAYSYLNGLGSGTMNPYWLAGNVSAYPAFEPLSATLSDGRIIVVWTTLAVGAGNHNYDSRFAFVTADTFGSASSFDSVPSGGGNAISIVGICVDASDTTHVLYIETANTKLWHNTISSSGSLGSPTLVEDFSGQLYDFGPGTMFNGKVTFTGTQGGDANVYLFETDPVTIAWTKKTVAARTNDTGGGVYPVPVAVSSRLYILWWEQDSTLHPASTNKGYYATYNGSAFTAKAVLWDAGANQYPGAGISPDGDVDMSGLTGEYSGGKLQVLGWSEFTSGFDETELYLERALGSSYINKMYIEPN